MKESFIDECKPVYVTAGVRGGPVYQGVKSAVVSTVGGVSGKPNGRVIKGVKCGECTFTSGPIDCVTIVKLGKNGHFYEGAFSRRSEGVTVSVEKAEFGLYLGL